LQKEIILKKIYQSIMFYSISVYSHYKYIILPKT
jgi:hypothetical protein